MTSSTGGLLTPTIGVGPMSFCRGGKRGATTFLGQVAMSSLTARQNLTCVGLPADASSPT